MADVETQLSRKEDVGDLHRFGYRQALRRRMGPFASFAIAFSMISITNAIFFLFGSIFLDVGGIGFWLWIPVAAGLFLIVLVYAHLAARIPITGFAYQWNSRLVNTHYGWFTGWTALLAFFAGTASIATAIASVFAGDIWANPTHGNIVEFALVMLVVAAIINVISIRAVSMVNNAGVVFEIVGSVGAALMLLIGSLFFFHHVAGFHILTQKGPVGGGPATLYLFALATLLPLYTFLGWEGAADLAEETADPRKVTPYAMIRANYVSVAAALLVLVGFMIAIPHGVPSLLGEHGNPLIYIFRSHFGLFASDVLQVIVFLAIFSCLLANMTVATRMTFSLARDKMLPGSSLLRKVNSRTRTPVFAILLVTVVAGIVNVLSAGIAANVVSIVNVSYYLIYVVTIIAVLYALGKGRVPEGLPGGFSLGRWITPVAIVALVFAGGVVLDMALPAQGHVADKYMIVSEALGVVWYFAYLRPRLIRRTVGVEREEVIQLERVAQDMPEGVPVPE